MRRVTLALVLSLAGAFAHAQLGLPGVRVALPLPQVPAIDRTLAGLDSQIDGSVLQNTRALQVRNLLRRDRATLEADPTGAAIVRNEIVAFSPSDADLASAQTAGFVVLGVRTLDGLDARVVILQAPQGLSTARALVRLRSLLPADQFDFNHVYTESGTAAGPSDAVGTAQPLSADPQDSPRFRLGLIDGGIDAAHPVFRDLTIHSHGCGSVPVPSPHGTAVASLMVGRSANFHGAAPGAELYAADVYCGLPGGGAVDSVAEALGWLVHERVAVINTSLVGPPNVILQAVVRMVVARGFIIVAAVGNDGPAAPPLYPASYPGVVGVTAVDVHRRVLVEAARGPQVRFAAPGADMVAAKSPQGFDAVRGTSFAAPLVACLLAAELREPDPGAATRAIGALASSAIDLGAHGLDPIYGYGLVAAGLGPDIRLADLHGRN